VRQLANDLLSQAGKGVAGIEAAPSHPEAACDVRSGREVVMPHWLSPQQIFTVALAVTVVLIWALVSPEASFVSVLQGTLIYHKWSAG
jgi:hypothetical protein